MSADPIARLLDVCRRIEACSQSSYEVDYTLPGLIDEMRAAMGAVEEAQHGVRSGVWHKRDPHWVPLHTALVAVVVEAPEVVAVAMPDGSLVRVTPGEALATVSPETSTEALRSLLATAGAMLERRMRGER